MPLDLRPFRPLYDANCWAKGVVETHYVDPRNHRDLKEWEFWNRQAAYEYVCKRARQAIIELERVIDVYEERAESV